MSKLVDHGSVLPAMRALKYTVLPSAEKAYSLSSPNGLDGTSPSMPALKWNSLPGLPSSRSAMNSCERRTKILSYTVPVALSASRASSFFLLQSSASPSPAHSGNTSIESSTCWPSGDSLKLLTSSASEVACFASPPFASTCQSWLVPSFGARKYTDAPSDDHCAPDALSASSLSRRGSPPARGTSHTPFLPLFAS